MQLTSNSQQQQEPGQLPLAELNPHVLNAVSADESVSQDAPAPGTPESIKQLNEYMMATYGVDLDGAMQFMQNGQQAQQQLQEVEVNRQMQTLQDAWGVDAGGLDQRMQVVARELEAIPEAQRALYDSLEGAQILWQRYVNRTGGGGGEKEVQAATPLDRSTGANSSFGGNRFDFTRSQLYGMSDADLRKNDAAITRAEAAGRIYDDV